MYIRSLSYLSIGLGLIGAAAAAACSAAGDDTILQGAGGSGGAAGGSTDGTTDGATATTSGGDGIDPTGATSGGGSSSGSSCNVADPSKDNDGDGWSVSQGDCNDCSAQSNPGAQDYPGNNIDEDCNGTIDDSLASCDSGLSVTSSNAIDGAKAMGICKQQSGDSWGLVSAQYVTADGKALTTFDSKGIGHGILSGLGPKVHPQEGAKLLALSSGTARQPTDPGYEPVAGFDKGYPSLLTPYTGAPSGYPKESPSCPGVETGDAHDSAGLRVKLRTPTNAKSLRFNLNFYTYEFPKYICSIYNDFFVALLSPIPAGQKDGNISFDSQGNLISVNAGFLQVCHPQTAGGKQFTCPLGFEQLTGTGFDVTYGGNPSNGGAATSWLETSSPVAEPGKEITLLFTIWDSGDGDLDSTILLDNFRFDIEPAETQTTPVPVPK